MNNTDRKFLSALIQLAEADKHFANAEREMIFRIASELNISEDNVTALIKNPEPVGPLMELTADQRFEYLFACVQLIHVDHNIFESELMFSKSIAIKLGFKRDVIDYLMTHFSTTSKNEIKVVVMSKYV